MRGFVTLRSLFCFVLAATMLLGCGKAANMVPVHGVVLYKGKPLEFGGIMFQPIGVEDAKTARSQISEDGTFELTTEKPGDGVMVGKCQVRITAFEAQRNGSQANQQQELALGRSAIPRRFQNFGSSGIEIDVTPDIELPLTIDLDQID